MLNHDWHSLISILIHKKNRIKFLDNSVKEIGKQSGFISHTKRLTIKQGQAEVSKLKVEKAQIIKHLSEIIWKQTYSQVHSGPENRPGQNLTGFHLIDKVTEAFYFEKQALEYVKGTGSLLPDILWCNDLNGTGYKSAPTKNIKAGKKTRYRANPCLPARQAFAWKKEYSPLKIIRFLKKPLRVACIVAILSVSTIKGYSQKAELTINVSDPNAGNANGIIEVNGNDSTYTGSLVNGSAYFMLKDVTSVVKVNENHGIRVWPVPVENGRLTIEINSNKEGILNIFEANGKKISFVSLPQQNELSFYSQTGILFVQFMANDGNQETVKVICRIGPIHASVKWDLSQDRNPKSLFLATDDYTISFTDPETDTEANKIEKNIPPGTHETINMITQYTKKTTGTNVNTNTNTRIIITGEKELANINSTDGTETININERFSKYKGLPITITLTGEYTDPTTINKTLEEGILTTIDTIRKGHYHVTTTGNGDDYTIEYNNTQVAQGIVGTESFFKLQGDKALLELIVKGEGLKTDTTYFTMNKGEITKEIILDPTNYTKTINFTVNSSEPTKTPKSFRGYVLIAGDTLAVANFNGNTGQLQYNTNNENEQAEIGAIKIPAHKDVKTNMTITETHNFNKTATIMYETSNVPILIKGERGLAVANVNITGLGSAKTTDADGKTTLDMILGADKTDINGLPYANYTTNISLASDDIINKNVDVNHNAGNNNEQDIEVQRNNYPYSVNLSITSSDGTKTPLGFRGYILLSGDTLAAKNFTGTNGQLQFNNNSPTINAQTGVKNIPYHADPTEKNINLDGNDNENFTATADISHYEVNGRVTEEGTSNPVNANVTTEGKNDDTNSNGDYTITNIIQRRGPGNEPLTGYTINIIATGDFTTITKQKTADGNNLIINFTTPQKTYEYWLEDNNSTPNGASVKGWKNGNEILTGNITGNSYETNHINRTTTTITLDSLVTDATGFIKEVTLNYTMSPNGTQHNFNLTEEQQNNTYNISGRGHLIGAIIAGEPNEAIDYLDDGDIRFTTKKDMTEHDIAINSNGNFNGDITGNYQPTDTILIDFINNPLVTTNTFSFLDGNYVASIGKIQNDDGSYVASANEPRFTQHNAWTTFEKLDGKNLVFIAFSDNAYSNDDAIDMIRGQANDGVISYIEPNVTFYNDTINHSTLLPISAQNRQDQDDAIDFLINQLTTRTGLVLTNTSKAYTDNNWTQPRGASYIFRSNLNPSNSVVGVGGPENTFYMSDASTRPSDNTNVAKQEISEGQGRIREIEMPGGGFSSQEGFIYHSTTGEITDFSWIGDVANKTAYLFPATFFEKK